MADDESLFPERPFEQILAADPGAANIPKPVGVSAMGVVGNDIHTILTYQLFGVRLVQLHEEFDVDGDGTLTRTEISNGRRWSVQSAKASRGPSNRPAEGVPSA